MFKNLIPWKNAGDTEMVEIDPKNEIAQFRANFDKMLNRILEWRLGGCMEYGLGLRR